MATRNIFLKDLNDDYTVEQYRRNGSNKVVLRNEARKGIVLTNPRLRLSVAKGVYFEDFDLTGEYTNNAIFTRLTYKALPR